MGKVGDRIKGASKWAMLALVPVVLIAADKPKDQAKAEQQQLQGTWLVVSFTEDGHQAPEALLKKVQVVFNGDHMVMQPELRSGRKGKGLEFRLEKPFWFEGAFQLHPNDNPKQMGWIHYAKRPDGRESLSQCQAIYALDGDRLTICLQPFCGPAKEFQAPKDSGRTLVILQRKKR